MPERIKEGDKLPFFRYDTPYSARNRSRELLAAHPPLVLVFMSNFGHPVTRTFAERYTQTHGALKDGSFAMVVRSRPDKLADSIGPDTLPYPLLCDADGTLYDYLQIPQRSGTLTTYSLEGWRIVREARRQGYRQPKNTVQQLPLTLILDGDGTVLFCHYGSSVTDVPEDCIAMQKLLETLELVEQAPEEPEAEEPAEDELPYEDPYDPALTAEGMAPPPEVALQDLPAELSMDSGEFTPPPAYITAGSYAPTADAPPEKPEPRRPQRHRPATKRYSSDEELLEKTGVLGLFDDAYNN